MSLVVRDLAVFYGDMAAVHGIDLEVGGGECVALVGSNGAGKTSALQAIAGLVSPSRGTVTLDGEDVLNLSTSARVHRGLVLCPENRRLFPTMTVTENLQLGVSASHLPRSDFYSRFSEMVDMFPILGDRRNQDAGTLSGGEQQMLAIARALISRPKLLLLDEPTMGLAPMMVQLILEKVTDIVASGCSVIISEQNVADTLRVSDRAYVMEAGQIVLSGISSDVATDETTKAAILGA